MDVKLYFIRDIIESGKVSVVKILTSYNPENLFTKVVLLSKFKLCLKLLRVGEF